MPPGNSWNLESFISESDLPFERDIAKNSTDLELWLAYYNHKNSEKLASFHNRIFILERAVSVLPKSDELWHIYLDLLLEKASNLSYYHNKTQVLWTNKLFERALLLLNTDITIWVKYLNFLLSKQKTEITLIRRKFNEALYNVPLKAHRQIWELYLPFADEVGGPTGVNMYLKFLKYADPDTLAVETVSSDSEGEGKKPLNLSIDYVILKLVEFGDFEEASKLYERILQHPDDYASLPKSNLQFRLEYIDLILHQLSNTEETSPSLDSYFESLVTQGIARYPDQIGTLYLKLTDYFIARDNIERARYFFEKGLKECLTVQDFTLIFDSFSDFEENNLTKLAQRLEEDPENSEISSQLDFRMHKFEQLIDNRSILLNDMMLRQDINNLDEWFKRIDTHKDNLNMVLKTYVSAISKVNPFKAHSLANIEENKLSKIWIDYANVYASRNDFATADLIYNKAVSSQFSDLDELAEIYIQYSEMLLQSNFDDADERAISVVEAVLFKDIAQDLDQNATKDIHYRLGKSTKLWQFYLDLLESFIESEDQTEEIEKVTRAYDRLVSLKIATVQSIINYAHFLQSWKFFERSFNVYEKGLKIFDDPTLKYEIWSVYLPEIGKREITIERMRDIFEQSLYGSGHSDEGCPAHLCKSLILLYADYERNHGHIMNSIDVLRKGISKILDGFDEDLPREEKNQILSDKFELYQNLISSISNLKDTEETRRTYERALRDDQLTLPQVIQLTTGFIQFETSSKQLTRVRGLFQYVTRLSHPESVIMKPIWDDWEQFEVKYGSESTFKDMLRFKRDVKNDFKNDKTLKDSLNPMGFVKSSAGPKVSYINASEDKTKQKEEANPDQIDLDMEM
ncbi:Pre-mRNA-splicing factor SYF1 [Scheffersomyces xylosifermentans]|uniref:Pre-mRNA-splicing factor SYF1 n=1 Tax=Scheffersomyces xylosifermentans TaxID=1304137 RepID=UPI00315C54FF